MDLTKTKSDIRSFFYRIHTSVLDISGIELISCLSILFNLVYASKTVLHRSALVPPLLILCGLAVFQPKLRTSAKLWFSVAFVQGAWLLFHWTIADNHEFLIWYWSLTLAVSFSLSAENQMGNIRRLAKWILALLFIFAVVQKVVFGEFFDGSTFYFLFITDPRFALFGPVFRLDLASLIGTNKELLRSVVSSGNAVTLLKPPPIIDFTSSIFSIYLVIVQSLLAVLFLIPSRWPFAWIRHILLCVFSFTTYTFFSITGFGLIIQLLGIADLEENEKVFRWIYIFMIVNILVTNYVF